ncbi:MAG: NYN domain-containing protein [Bacteroidales bacterium]|nr:NYN domain-containing protein [Bacteroidales bacterium]MDE6146827.1 NYN domain-containing protein [Bacteroidales bacterium]
MANLENRSIGVFIDGGYFAKINEALHDKFNLNVNIKALFRFIPELIGKFEEIDVKRLFITESHYYRGRYRVNDAQSKHLLFSERKFEDSLIENDIIIHYKHLREVQGSRGTTVIEKGIDTWFALDTYEMTLYRDFDYVVLISGDADHEMLARKLKALKTHVILLTWDPADTGSTSMLLSEEACTHIEIKQMTEKDPGLLKRLCIQI